MNHLCSAWFWRCRRSLAVVSLALIPLLAAAKELQETSETENYFYTGLDMFWVEGGKKYPVHNFSKKRVQIRKDGKLVSVRKGGSLVYASRSKVSQRKVDLEIDKIDMKYSGYEADYEALQSTFSLLAIEEDSFDQNATSFFRSGSRFSIVQDSESLLSGSSLEAMSRTQSNIENFENVRIDLEENMNSSSSLVDTVVVEGELRLPTGDHDGYMMFLVSYSVVGSTKSLQPVHRSFRHKGESPYVFKYSMSGFPAGFQIEDVQVHVFSGGREIPHQDSQGLRVMSDQEYYEYLFSKYRKSSGRDEPVLFRRLDADAVAELAPSKRLDSIKVEIVVKPDGSPRVEYMNVGYVEEQQPLVALLEKARFFPAMENGRLVESKLFVPLSSLVQ